MGLLGLLLAHQLAQVRVLLLQHPHLRLVHLRVLVAQRLRRHLRQRQQAHLRPLRARLRQPALHLLQVLLHQHQHRQQVHQRQLLQVAQHLLVQVQRLLLLDKNN